MLARAFSLLLIMAAACGEATTDDVRPAPPSYDGKNRVLSFDGLNDYATTGTAGFPIAYGPQTLMLWARPARVVVAASADASPGDEQCLVVLRKDFDSGVVLGLRNGSFEVWSVYSGRTYARMASAAEPGVWQHIAYAFDGSLHRLYVNGKLQDSSTAETSNRTPTTAWLGSIDGSADLFVGEMDEVRFYATSLDDSALMTLATANRGPTTPRTSATALVAWFGFDEVSGHRAIDRSDRGNDALLGDGILEHMPERVIEGP